MRIERELPSAGDRRDEGLRVPESSPARALCSRSALGQKPAGGVAMACLVTVASCLLLASSASALYVDTAAPVGSGSTLDLQIEGHSISVLDEIKTIEIRSDDHGIRLRFKVAFKTIEFNDGPVLLDRFDFAGGTGRAVATSSAGPMVVVGGRSVNQMVSRLRIAGRSNVAAARGLHVELQRPIASSQPIPEPGAALLFAAGLAAVGAAGRRKG